MLASSDKSSTICSHLTRVIITTYAIRLVVIMLHASVDALSSATMHAYNMLHRQHRYTLYGGLPGMIVRASFYFYPVVRVYT